MHTRGTSADKSRILEHTTGLEAQQQCISLVEDCINTVVDMPAEVARYQKALNQAGSKLDLVFGINLSMAPVDMTLNIARHIVGYNNEILVATEDLTIGKNENINANTIPQDYGNGAGDKGVVVLQESTVHTFTSTPNQSTPRTNTSTPT